jgi:hypothetical protein
VGSRRHVTCGLFIQYNLFAPFWLDFKNFVGIGIGVVLSQPFTEIHFHFLVIVETATSQVPLQRPKQ